MERAALEEAYRATTYRVGKLDLRVGQPHPVLDEILRVRGLERYAWITAVNPRGERLPESENRRRLRALAERLHGWVYLRGHAVADAGDWPPEPSFLVLGMGEEDALALAREFDQNAVLVGETGGRPRLAWT